MSDDTLRDVLAAALLGTLQTYVHGTRWNADAGGLTDAIIAALAARNVVLARGDAPTPEPLREAFQERGWYVAEVATGAWVESSDWTSFVIAVLGGDGMGNPPSESVAALAATESPDTRVLDVAPMILTIDSPDPAKRYRCNVPWHYEETP